MATVPSDIFNLESEDLFDLANLSPKRTGLPFVVWISQKGGAPHDVRVKISTGPRIRGSDLISIALRPDVHVIGNGQINSESFSALKKWIDMNLDVILKYWTGEIEYTEDAIAALKPIE